MAARRRTLYLCYLSLDDPLVDTQVVAYLRGLAAAGHQIHLLTFETRRLTRGLRRTRREALSRDGIQWHGLRYHKRPSLPATVYDTLVGALYATWLVLRHRLDTLHARAHVPAAMSLIVMGLLRPRAPLLIFDIRGLMAEEYEDAGRWTRESLPFRLTKRVERQAIRRAAAVVVLTQRICRYLFGERPPIPTYVIPCCADISQFRVREPQREQLRQELGLGPLPTMVYVGKFGSWYMADEMAEFFSVARQRLAELQFLILTQDGRAEIELALSRRGVSDGCTITSVEAEGVARFLAACDFGICFIRPVPSKASSSPTKIGEYLAAGLPVVYSAGIGDLDRVLSREVGVPVSTHDTAAHLQAAEDILSLVEAPGTAARCHGVAQREFSLQTVGIPRYLTLYDALAGGEAGAS